ncbi:unnamed protein product [Gongylonema pulchrum]|uniref:PKcGMP_CC domain-containing protein n=1 Tax=Gongylonema pulchrum TaxID=637853 RepID=A0A183EXS8_9BILA|nr:unnamed protein product [Gongylonema pulchrum]
MQSAQPHCSPVMADSASGSSPDIPSPPTNSEKVAVVESQAAHIDPSDTSALLSATTLSIHEEMLRFQQRKIEELQKELDRSQQQLKHQQQVILAAKKAQVSFRFFLMDKGARKRVAVIRDITDRKAFVQSRTLVHQCLGRK